MFDAALQGLQNLLSLNVLIGMLAGIGVGTFTAVTPQGLGTPLMYALFLSMVTQWDPLVAIAFLIGMDAVSSTCSAYLPVLFGIPGRRRLPGHRSGRLSHGARRPGPPGPGRGLYGRHSGKSRRHRDAGGRHTRWPRR